METKAGIEELKAIVEKNPSDYDAQKELAFLYLDDGALNSALEIFIHLTEIFSTDADLFFNTGIIYEKLKDFPNALISYKKAVELSPNDADFNYNLAFLYDQMGEVNNAIALYKKVLSLDSQDSNSYFNLGCLLSKLNQSQDAIFNLENAIKLNTEDAYAYFYLAYEYNRTGGRSYLRTLPLF